MSYCRWSDDGCQCDVYAYADVYGGYTVHVAKNRRLKRVCDPDFSSVQALQRTLEQRRRELEDESNKILPINGPFDGQTFTADTLEDLLSTMQHLRHAGYNVPDFALSCIQDEINEKYS